MSPARDLLLYITAGIRGPSMKAGICECIGGGDFLKVGGKASPHISGVRAGNAREASARGLCGLPLKSSPAEAVK